MISPELLRRYPTFAGVSESCLKSVAEISEERSFKDGEKIFEESGELKASAHLYEKGDEASHLMILTKGQVDIAFELTKDRKIVVGTLAAGDLMAISALVPPYRLMASGIAKEDGSLIQIEAPELRELLEENPELGYRLLKGVSQALLSRLNQTRIELAGQTPIS
jgi:CRP/FNR family cyclic AMP-dependent transcriptional regulator